MTPLKDTLEVSSSSEGTSVSPVLEHARPESGALRADAVSLEVPVKVHGSRVSEVVRGITPHTEPFEEQTTSMIVFPKGGVLRMSTPVTAGQMMVVTNVKSGHDAICRVVKVRAYAPSQSYVEIEFTNRQQGYWGVQFAGDDVAPATQFAPLPSPAASSVSTTVRFEASSTPASSPVLAPPPPLPPVAAMPPAVKRPEPPPVFAAQAKSAPPTPDRSAKTAKPESTFVGIGAQEEVQPAASTTSFKKKPERLGSPAASLSITELLGDGPAALPISASLGSGVPGEVTDLSTDLEESISAQGSAPPAALSPAAVFTPVSEPVAPQKVFGARFDTLASPALEQTEEVRPSSSTHWFLIATGIAALLVAAVGGAFYFRLLPGAQSNARVESAPPAVHQPEADSNSPIAPAAANSAAGSPAQVLQPSAESAPPTVLGPGISARTSGPVITNRAQPVAATNQKPERALPDMSAALAAHPVSAQRAASDAAATAPSVDGGDSSAGELQQMSSPADVTLPPPPPVRVKVGGYVQAPELIKSMIPAYPSVAKSTGITGNVVIQASISKTGAVVATKVLSGPPVLRQAAVDALLHWKYKPATLDGLPIAVDITVTMSFHNQ
jgi:TonB family protein